MAGSLARTYIVIHHFGRTTDALFNPKARSPSSRSWRPTPWRRTSCSSPTSSTSLALCAGDAPKALALFSSLRAAGIRPDLKAYNAAIAAYCKSDLLRDAKRLLLHDVPADGVAPDAESYAPVLAALARRGRQLAAVSLFSHMRAVARSSPTSPSSTSCSTRTGSWTSRAPPTGSSGPCAGPVCRRASARAGGRQGQEPGAANTGQRHQAQRRHLLHRPVHLVEGREELDRAAKLFEKLRESGTEMDPVLYQTMVVAYERAGLVSQSKRPLRELRDPDQAIPKDTTMKQRRAGGGGRVAVRTTSMDGGRW
uniref:Pentacotripeptide-repeat region of PRORP domain-containing protein n=1 Tax=Aegilops tauschii TaxID=37682 RepID=M8C9V2_AEGTA